jgi:hypothetical protein
VDEAPLRKASATKANRPPERCPERWAVASHGRRGRPRRLRSGARDRADLNPRPSPGTFRRNGPLSPAAMACASHRHRRRRTGSRAGVVEESPSPPARRWQRPTPPRAPRATLGRPSWRDERTRRSEPHAGGDVGPTVVDVDAVGDPSLAAVASIQAEGHRYRGGERPRRAEPPTPGAASRGPSALEPADGDDHRPRKSRHTSRRRPPALSGSGL